MEIIMIIFTYVMLWVLISYQSKQIDTLARQLKLSESKVQLLEMCDE